MLDVTGFINRPLFFLFQCLKVVQLLTSYVSKASFKTIIKKPFIMGGNYRWSLST